MLNRRNFLKTGFYEGIKVVSVPTEGGSDLAEAAVWELHGVSRRSFIRTGLAVGGGLVAAMYVKPAFQTIGIPRAFAAVSPAPGGSCTPGFWKNHESEWPSPYTTTTVYASVFSVPAAYSASLGSGKSFETVVAQGGGCEKSLGRHSVAALLNATKLTAGIFGKSGADVISETNAALATETCTTIETKKDEWDQRNNGACLDGGLIAD